jgi:hypothetical protein
VAVGVCGVFGANSASAADTTPPTVTVTMHPSAPPAGQDGYFNAHDLAAQGGNVIVHVSASDPSGVIDIKCVHNDPDAPFEPTIDFNQSGTSPRSGSFPRGDLGSNRIHCEATDGSSSHNQGVAAGSHNRVQFLLDPDAPTVATSRLGHFQTSRSVDVAWSGHDRYFYASGVRAFDVDERVAPLSGAFGAMAGFREQNVPAANAIDNPIRGHGRYHGTPGTTTCFFTRATDRARNSSAYTAPHCTAFPLDDRAFARNGCWAAIRGAGFYAGTLLRSGRAGSRLTSPVVTGSKLALLVSTGPHGGAVRVSWHGQSRTLSLRSAHRHNRHLIGLPGFAGTGRVRVKLLGGGSAAIDGLGVWKHP